MLLLAAAAVSLMPQPIGLLDWFSPATFPPKAIENGDIGRTGFQLVVSPDGKPVKCDVAVSSGNRDIDLTTCIDALRFGKFKPGHDLDGKAVFSVYQNWVLWDSLAAKKLPPPPPKIDFDIALREIPARATKNPRVDADILVRNDGAIESCTPVPSHAADVLGSVACQQIVQNWKPVTAIDERGDKQRSVQRVRVGFTDPSHSAK